MYTDREEFEGWMQRIMQRFDTTEKLLESQLDGSALPGSSDAVLQVEVDLRAVECAVPLIYHVGQSQLIEGASESLCCKFPVLVASHAVLRSRGELYMVLEAEQGIYLVDEACYILDLVADLLRGHEDVGVVLRKAAHAHQAVECSGELMAVHQAQLADADASSVTFGSGFISIPNA